MSQVAIERPTREVGRDGSLHAFHRADRACARCGHVDSKAGIDWRLVGWRALYAASWVLALPYIVMSGIGALGIFLFAPLAMLLGLSLSALFAPKVFPKKLCKKCGRSLAG
ncbi:MAG: hypothetical protein U0271_12030 [Polyangiaceae bacterium]